MDALHHGSCLCGTIKYRVSTELKAVTHRHCTMCQKGHGAAFATYASAPSSTIAIIAGTEMLKGYESSAGVLREFCSNCGSSLFWSDSRGEFAQLTSIAIATLDSPFTPKKQKHGCVSSMVSWYELADGPPQTV
jgi:hypothetical protein